MQGFPTQNEVERLRRRYPQGTRIELEYMDDPYSKLKPGDRGSVTFVDDAGTVFVNWDSGSGLGLAYGEDKFRKLTEQELAEEQYEEENFKDTEETNNMTMGGI